MTTLKEMCPVQYFRGSDLKGPTLPLTIEQFTEEENYGKNEWICWFDEDARGLRLSFKNAERLALAAKSENNQDWIGLRVRLSPKSFTNTKGEPGTTIDLEVVPTSSQNGGPALPGPQEPPKSPPKSDMDQVPF